jgi:hypothetical protein
MRWVTFGLGALFLAQGLGKLLDVDGYVAALGRFPLVPADAARPLGVSWIAVEMATGIALLALSSGRARGTALRIASGAAVTLAAAYAVLAYHGYLAGADVPNCTCFGVYLRQRLGVPVLIQEALMLWWTVRHLLRVGGSG